MTTEMTFTSTCSSVRYASFPCLPCLLPPVSTFSFLLSSLTLLLPLSYSPSLLDHLLSLPLFSPLLPSLFFSHLSSSSPSALFFTVIMFLFLSNSLTHSPSLSLPLFKSLSIYTPSLLSHYFSLFLPFSLSLSSFSVSVSLSLTLTHSLPP